MALTIVKSSLICHFPSVSFICFIKSKMVDHGEMKYGYNHTMVVSFLWSFTIYISYPFFSVLWRLWKVTHIHGLDDGRWRQSIQCCRGGTRQWRWKMRGPEHSPSFSVKLTIAFSRINQILLSRSHSTSIYLFQVNFSKTGHWHLNNYVEAKVSYSFDYNISHSVIQEPHA